MGVSFKVAKVGTRYKPKVNLVDDTDLDDGDCGGDGVKENSALEGEINGVSDHSSVHSNSVHQSAPQDLEVSFTLNLFPDGFSIGKPSELVPAVPTLLHPYDRASKMLFSAIEYGMLPGDILEDIPCKFLDGALFCEVRDCRECVPKSGNNVCPVEKTPVVHRVRLQMCMESVVKDIPSIADGSWSYNDLLELESRILKSLQPELYLDPTPLLERLCGSSGLKKLNLGIFDDKEKRKQRNKTAENLVSNNIPNNLVLEHSNGNSYPAVGDGRLPQARQATSLDLINKQQSNIMQESLGPNIPSTSQSMHQTAVCSPMSFSTADAIPSNFSCVPEYDTDSCGVGINSSASLHGKRDRIEFHSTSWPNMKRPKQKQMDPVQVQPQHVHSDSTLSPSVYYESVMHQQEEAENINGRLGGMKSSYVCANDIPEARLAERPSLLGQGGVYTVEQEPVKLNTLQKEEMRNITKSNQILDSITGKLNPILSKVQHFTPQSRAHLPSSAQWGQLVDHDLKTQASTKRRRSAQTPWVSSPLPSYLESPSFSKETPCNTPLTTVFSLPKEVKSMPVPADKSASPSNSQNSKEKKASVSGKRKYTSRLKNVCGAGSPAIASNVSTSCNGSIPVTATPSSSLPEKTDLGPILGRFLKIQTISQRYQLNSKKSKCDRTLGKRHNFHAHQLLQFQLSVTDDNEDDCNYNSDELFMSRLLLWRNLKICVTRTLKFIRQRHIYLGGLPVVIHDSQKLVVSENPRNEIVEVYIILGNDEENEDDLPKYNVQLFFDTHSAHVYADQFTLLSKREGYHLIDDQLKAVCFHSAGASCSQQIDIGREYSSETTGASAAVPYSGQLSNMLSPVSRNNSLQRSQQLLSKNILAGGPTTLPGNINAASHFSTSFASNPIQDRSVNVMSWNQQQRCSIQTSMLNKNPNPNTRVLAGNQLLSDPAVLQLLLQQQHPVMQKTTAGGLGMAVGMKNQGTMQQCGGLITGNLIGRGVGRNAINMGNTNSTLLGQQGPVLSYMGKTESSFDLCQQLPPRGRGVRGASVPETWIDGFTGNNMINSGSLWGQASTRGGMAQYQYPTTMVTGLQRFATMNSNINNQLQTQQQLATIQQMLSPPDLRQEELDLMQRILSPQPPQLAFSNPQEMGLPSTPASLDHSYSQTEMKSHNACGGTSMSPQQESSGMFVQQQLNSGITTVGPMSPQLSSHTHGSVGSITGSPMELQSGCRGE